MTVYLMKLPYVPNPIIIDSDEHSKGSPNGMYYNFFRQYNNFEWIKKVLLPKAGKCD